MLLNVLQGTGQCSPYSKDCSPQIIQPRLRNPGLDRGETGFWEDLLGNCGSNPVWTVDREPKRWSEFERSSNIEILCLTGQVITGGHYDVDCRLEDPDGNVLYKEMKKQYDSYTFTASKNGTYKFCFSNEFSTFTHKTVYFDFQVGEDPPLFPSENRVSALTQMESACVSIHEALKSVIDYQTHFRLREAQGRSRAEDLNTRVAYWSVGEALILLVVSIGQVFLLKSFFSDKRTTTTRVGS
uniref:GOLD domain-containing protein n=1 Tax=Capra hircus TaxID=9925 RepID=A0A8C2P2R4_CAPHI